MRLNNSFSNFLVFKMSCGVIIIELQYIAVVVAVCS